MAERKARLMHRLRMRTTLLIPLLLLCFGGTPVSLLILSTIVKQQVKASLASDLQHSVQTYQNLARQKRELLVSTTTLLADEPRLKALMHADSRTIADGGVEFWQDSGSDFLALLDRNGKLIVSFNHGAPLARQPVEQGLQNCLSQPEGPVLVAMDRRLYEISLQPMVFGDQEHGSRLGFIAVGYEVDTRVAREVSESAAAEVTFTVGNKYRGQYARSPNWEEQLVSQEGTLLSAPTENHSIQLGNAGRITWLHQCRSDLRDRRMPGVGCAAAGSAQVV